MGLKCSFLPFVSYYAEFNIRITKENNKILFSVVFTPFT